MNSPSGKPLPEADDVQPDGVNMRSLCLTLARVLVQLEEKGYTELHRQVAVMEHDDLPDPASDESTRKAK